MRFAALVFKVNNFMYSFRKKTFSKYNVAKQLRVVVNYFSEDVVNRLRWITGKGNYEYEEKI